MTDPAPPPLSPAAQAVWKAFEMVECDEFLIDPRRAGLAAALRVVAHQVAPDEPDYMRSAIPDAGWWDKQDYIRQDILDIANELHPSHD